MTAERIREIRLQFALSQSQFAEILGVHPLTVSRWETGRYDIEAVTLQLFLAWDKMLDKESLSQRKRDTVKEILKKHGGLAAFCTLMTGVRYD